MIKRLWSSCDRVWLDAIGHDQVRRRGQAQYIWIVGEIDLMLTIFFFFSFLKEKNEGVSRVVPKLVWSNKVTFIGANILTKFMHDEKIRVIFFVLKSDRSSVVTWPIISCSQWWIRKPSRSFHLFIFMDLKATITQSDDEFVQNKANPSVTLEDIILSLMDGWR